MQWMKRYWDQSFPGGEYDALQRRKGGGPTTKSTAASRTVRSKPTTPSAGNQDKDLFHCLMLSLSLSLFCTQEEAQQRVRILLLYLHLDPEQPCPPMRITAWYRTWVDKSQNSR